MNHYKSWSGLNNQLAECLCDSLRNRVTYFLTRYHEVHNSYGRAAIRLDGKELAVFSWIDMYKQDSDLNERWEETGIWDSDALELKNKWEKGGILSDWDFLQAARDNQIEVIYFQHDDGPGTGFSIGDEEFEIAEQAHPREGEKIFTKNINSCFGNKDFTDYVKDENTLMIVGLQTNFCIDATVKSAFERGYKVIVPQGANSTFDNDYMSGEETYKYYNDMM